MADTLLGLTPPDNTGAGGGGQDNQAGTQGTQTGTQEAQNTQGAQGTQGTQGAQGTQGTQSAQTLEGGGTQGEGQPPQPPAGPPEKYEFKLPEGLQLDQALLDEATPVFKELKLTQEQAQKLVDLQARAARRWAEAQIQEHQNLVISWRQEAEKDSEFGGQNLKENVAIAIKALNEFGTPGLRELLEATGLGNHPEVIRFFFRVGKAIKEPNVVGGGGQPPEQKSTAQILFPSMKG